MGRQYDVGDSQYPSVTTILSLLDKPFLLPWAAEQAAKYVIECFGKGGQDFSVTNIVSEAKTAYQKVSGEAKDIGSQVHQLIEYHIKAKMNNKELPTDKDYDEETKLCYKQFLIWEDQYQPIWLESEKTVYNTELGYAGTLDAVCNIGGDIFVIDFKTDKQISDTYPMQISAYQEAYNMMQEESNGMRANSQGILRLPKNGDVFEWIDYSAEFERNLIAFAGLLQYYYYSKKRRLKNNKLIKKIWN